MRHIAKCPRCGHRAPMELVEDGWEWESDPTAEMDLLFCFFLWLGAVMATCGLALPLGLLLLPLLSRQRKVTINKLYCPKCKNTF
jgi:hypothetical protein